MTQLNWLAIGVAALVHFLLGSLWYSPKVFGKLWMSAVGMSTETAEDCKKGMIKAMIICFIACIFVAATTVHLVGAFHATSIKNAIHLLACPAIGWVAAPIAMGIEFEKKKWHYWWITTGYIWAGIAIGIIAAFKI